MLGVLSLNGWGDIAQFVLALSAVLALGGAFAQVRISAGATRRSRVYEFTDAFNSLELLRASAEHKKTWPTLTVSQISAMSEEQQLECMRLPNMIEEVAHLYNRGVIDRNVAAEVLGVFVEKHWQSSERVIRELRKAEHRPRIFIDWQQMQSDTWRRRGAPGPLGVVSDGTSFRPRRTIQWYLSADFRQRTRSEHTKQMNEAL